MRPLSYSQRFEDLHLMRCFKERESGFYIDIGAGHPVYDNVSFAFYLKGWNGIAVEPNPRLAALGRAIRPRDILFNGLAGTTPGEATFYLVDDYHGFSTTSAENAATAKSEFGKSSQQMTRPVTTLAALCEQHAPETIDFLKVDVEGAEPAVLAGADWTRFRPKVIVVEALAPFTQEPAWDAYEPLLFANGYSYALFDSLNRYYVAAEEPAIAETLKSAPATFDVPLFRDCGKALDDPTHPDHRLATLLAGPDMAGLPLLPADAQVALLTRTVDPATLAAPATTAGLSALSERLFGTAEKLPFSLPAGATIRDAYAAVVDSEPFRVACGRISASSAW